VQDTIYRFIGLFATVVATRKSIYVIIRLTAVVASESLIHHPASDRLVPFAEAWAAFFSVSFGEIAYSFWGKI